jgi:hypothetical protein
MRSNFFRAYGFWHCGEGFQTILLMWYMTFHAGLSAAQIGLYQSLQLAPFLLFTAPAGSLTDRIGARTSFAAATGGFAVLLCLYGLADRGLGFSGPLFAGYCLLSGLFSALSNPAIDTYIPEATPRPTTENALIAATVHNIAKLTGNAATLALPVLDAAGGFAVNGLLMAVSVGFLLCHPRRPRPAGPAPALATALPRLGAHFRTHPASLDILISSAFLGLVVVSAFYVFQPLTLRSWFPHAEGLMGLMGVIGWVAAILASGLAARLAARIRHPGRLALGVWALVAAAFAVLTLVPNLAAYGAVLFVLGVNGLGKALVYGAYLREAPAEDRALLIGLDQTAYWGFATIGTAGLGLLVEFTGLAPALLAVAGMILVATVLLALRGHLWRLGAEE